MRAASVGDPARVERSELACARSLRGDTNRHDAERQDDHLLPNFNFVLCRGEREIPQLFPANEGFLHQRKSVRDGEEMRTDDDLHRIVIRKEKRAVEYLITKALVRVRFSQCVKQCLGVKVRVNRALDIQRHEVAIRVPLTQVPGDALR